MTIEELKLYMRQIAALYGCKVRFVNDIVSSASLKGHINVGLINTPNNFVSSFCHELAHHCNQIDGKFKKYHDRSFSWFNPNNLEKSIDYALKAERYTDHRGKMLCKQWFPEFDYIETYQYKNSWQFLYNYYKKAIK